MKYRAVDPSERLPKEEGSYLTNKGYADYYPGTDFWHIITEGGFEYGSAGGLGIGVWGEPIDEQAEEQELAKKLAPIYKGNRAIIAKVCDEVLDRTGALLGEVRKIAAGIKSSSG